jgi:HlyD family secretion protein
MSPTLKRWLPAAIILCAVAVFIGLKATRPQQPQVLPKERIWYVETVVAQPQRLAPALTLYGQVETPDLIKAAAPGRARVQQVLVREGSSITPNQVVLTLDPRDFEPKVLQAQARVNQLHARIASEQLRHASDRDALKHDQSLLELAQLAVERAEKMKRQKLGSEAALDQAREVYERQALVLTARKLVLDDHSARMDQLRAQLQEAEAELASVRLDLERSRIHAPFAGYIAQVDVAAGDQVTANQFLLSMYPSDKLEVRAKIPAPFQAELQRAVAGGERLQATADFAGAPLLLTLDRIAGEADPRGIDAFFRIDRGAGQLRLGSRLSLALRRPAHDDAVAIPAAALYGSQRIYTLADGRLQGIDVTRLGERIGPHGAPELLVTSPQIKAGDRIVISHLPNAVTGLRAEPISDEPDDDAT